LGLALQSFLCKDVFAMAEGRKGEPGGEPRGAEPGGRERTYTLDDPEALRALAHPLRGHLLAALRLDGPATASMLGRRYGESSGATSYHLRMLARYGFVEDDPTRRAGRERWWRAAHELTEWSPAAFLDSEPGEGEAARQFMRRVLADYARWQALWIDELEDWDSEWRDASEMSDLALRLTPAQLKALREELLATILRYRDAGPDGEGAERVIVLLQAFPQRGELP
jgi:DNA-binding transcriptional ArsR family regulator